MPGVIWVMASEYQDVPGKFELTVALAQITFPYILLISLVSLLAGILNSLSRFAPGASFPILLNLVLIVALLLGRSEEHKSELQSLMRLSYAVFCLQKKH